MIHWGTRKGYFPLGDNLKKIKFGSKALAAMKRLRLYQNFKALTKSQNQAAILILTWYVREGVL
jgi:hypothetical protein